MQSSTSTISRVKRCAGQRVLAGVLLVLLVAASAGAQTAPAKATASAAQAKKKRPSQRPWYVPWSYSLQSEGLFGLNGQSFYKDTLFNPGNLQKLSPAQGFGELRVNGQFKVRNFALVVRPRVRAVERKAPETNPITDNTAEYVDFYANEFYLKGNWEDLVELAVGRQNFQWGSAELTSPTNIFFPEIIARPEPYFEIRGVTLAKLNFSLGGSWSWITMAELPPIKDYSWGLDTPDDQSQKRVLTKIEYSWGGGANSLGVVAGSRNRIKATPVAGAYFALTPSEAWQFYADVLGAQGSDSSYPDANGFFFPSELDNNDVFVFALGGVRYTFKGGLEMRVELIRNDFGYDQEKQDTTVEALKRGGRSQLGALLALLNSTSPLYGRDYVYSALRWTGAGTFLKLFQQPTIALRNLHSLADQSNFLSTTLETGVSERSTIYAFAAAALGGETSEFKRSINALGGIAYRYSF